MAAKKLTKAEKVWLSRLEDLMSDVPTKRLACYTIGDNDLMFYDQNVSEAWERENPREQIDATELHRRAGSALGSVSGRFRIDSCAG
jgi:hypothetical protein